MSGAPADIPTASIHRPRSTLLATGIPYPASPASHHAHTYGGPARGAAAGHGCATTFPVRAGTPGPAPEDTAMTSPIHGHHRTTSSAWTRQPHPPPQGQAPS